MANQITMTDTFALAGAVPHELVLPDLTIDQTLANQVYDDVWTCPASDTVQSFGAIAGANYGWLVLQNLDATNYVDFGATVSSAISPLVRIPPGKRAGPFLVVPSITPRTLAHTGSCKVRATMYAA